jgi:fucose 4-O-acetylase-like acetyltransferase
METVVRTQERERKRYLDAAKGWGITLVVFGHITSLGNPVDTYISAYKLVIFYIVSGYLMCMRQSFRRYDLRGFFRKQAKSLLVPYFGYSIIVMAYQVAVGFMKGNTGNAIVKKLIEQLYTTLTFRGISALWFLPSLFLAQILFYLVMKSPLWVKIISGVIPLLTSWYVSGLLPVLKAELGTVRYKIISFPILTVSKGILAFWFVGAGYICYLLLSRFKNREGRFILGLVMTVMTVLLSQYNKGVDVNLMGIGKVSFLFYFNGVIGSLGIILVLEYLEKWWKMRYLTFCGRNSLVIMATHGTLGFKVLLIKGWQAVYTLSETAGLRYYLECSGILMELMLLECGVIKVVKTYFPWLK